MQTSSYKHQLVKTEHGSIFEAVFWTLGPDLVAYHGTANGQPMWPAPIQLDRPTAEQTWNRLVTRGYCPR